MRLLIINLLATAMLLFSAASASAWSINIVEQTGFDSGVVTVGSEIVIVNIFLDADPGLQLLSVGVMYDPTILSYEPLGSSSPSYILYSAGSGAQPTTYLTPVTTPAAEWPGTPTAGGPGGQVNVDWIAAALEPALASGLGIHIATLAFHVTGDAGDGIGEIFLSNTANGNILRAFDVVIAPSSIGLGGGSLGGGIQVHTPEPTTALLVGLGLIGLGVAGRRRA